MRKLCAYFKRREGSVTVEFGIVSLFFLVILFGIIELSRVFWTWNTLQYATESTARYALTHQEATNSDLVLYAADSMEVVSVDSADLTVATAVTTIGGIQFIEVETTYIFTTMLPLLPAGMDSITLTAKARMPYSV